MKEKLKGYEKTERGEEGREGGEGGERGTRRWWKRRRKCMKIEERGGK